MTTKQNPSLIINHPALSPINVLIATFSPWHKNQRMPTNGMVEPMLSFFIPKVNRVVLLDQPHPGSDKIMPQIEIYETGVMVKKTTSSFLVAWLYPFMLIKNSVGTQIPFKVRDFLSVLDFMLYDKKQYQIFIGMESINTLAGVFLKKIGLVRTVIYYVSDYSPQRYRNPLFNKLYLYLDRQAAYKADFIWDVSTAMMPAREQAGLIKSHAALCIHVPNALFPEQISFLPESKIIPKSLVFAGTLGEENGPDLAIEALSYVHTKIPGVKLHIFGGGDSDLKRLQTLTETLKLKDDVVFHGFINNQIELSQKIQKYSVGLAPYKGIPGSPRWWADATKIRLYLAAGLPVVTTQVPPLGKELIKEKAGLIANDNPQDLANAIIKLLENHTLYKQTRQNAIKKAQNNTWENTYSQAFDKMGLDI